MPDRTFQQILIMQTMRGTLRSEAFGWTAEDPRGAHPSQPVGICGAMWHRPGDHNTAPHRPTNPSYCYPDPLRALADGWKLLGAPVHFEGEPEVWEWWFGREVTA